MRCGTGVLMERLNSNSSTIYMNKHTAVVDVTDTHLTCDSPDPDPGNGG